jgi:hypothetical protein
MTAYFNQQTSQWNFILLFYTSSAQNAIKKSNYLTLKCGKTEMENYSLYRWHHWKEKPVRQHYLFLMLDAPQQWAICWCS